MKTKNENIQFKKVSLVELNASQMNAVNGGTFSTNSASGPLCDMIDWINRIL